MVRMFVMQSMAVHPGDRIDIEPEGVIHDGDGFDEPFLVIKRTVGDTQMEKVRQVQAAKEPTKDEISGGYQCASPRSQVRWGEIDADKHVGKHDQIAGEIVDFHQCSASGYSSRKNANGEEFVWCRNCSTQAKIGLEWATVNAG